MGVSMYAILYLNTFILSTVLCLQWINFVRLQKILHHLNSIDKSVEVIEEQYNSLGTDEEVLMLIEKIKQERSKTL